MAWATHRRLFLTSKVRLHCDELTPVVRRSSNAALFLTSKVRLHCDYDKLFPISPDLEVPFPDLKGQAPLRLDAVHGALAQGRILFLTSKVRLHCDGLSGWGWCRRGCLFLTSKVRLHCDRADLYALGLSVEEPFPDLKGQAPLRRLSVWRERVVTSGLFLTSKVRLHCDQLLEPQSESRLHSLFLTSKVRLHCDKTSVKSIARRIFPLFLTSKVRLHCDTR